MSRDTSPGAEAVEAAAAATPPALAVVLAWVVPGAGHLLLGRRTRALAFFLIVCAALTVGLLLDGNLDRVVPGHPLSMLATLASMGVGAPYFILRFLAGYEGVIGSAGFEYGTAFIRTAGLMNLLLVLDVWDIARGRKQ